jgi:isoamylase
VLATRWRQMRNFLATLFISQGVPMLLAGDEFGRTQQGNNNAYCQDNEISWLNWDLDSSQQELLHFTRLLIRLFHKHPVLRRRNFFQGRGIRGSKSADISWYRPDGGEISDDDWNHWWTRSLGMLLVGDAIGEVDMRGNKILDDTLLVLLNGHHETIPFVLPEHRMDCNWELVFDTREPLGRRKTRHFAPRDTYRLEERSVVLLRLPRPKEVEEEEEVASVPLPISKPSATTRRRRSRDVKAGLEAVGEPPDRL